MKVLGQPAVILSVAALFTLLGCADLDVTNENEVDRERALSLMEDVTTLVSGSFQSWFNGVFVSYGPGRALSQTAFQYSTKTPCHSWNLGMLPRLGFENANPYPHSAVDKIWNRLYEAPVALSDGLKALDDPELTQGNRPEELAMHRALARFGQGISHATVAAFFDRGFIIDETVDLEEAQPPLGYQELMEASFACFDEAIEIAEKADFTLPYEWMQPEVTSEDLARIAHSLKARFRAQVARTRAEREAVDWTEVIADVDAGIQASFTMEMDWDGWENITLGYATWPGWSQIP